MTTLPEKQEAILTFIKEFADEHSYPPSIREIQEACNISSTSVVDYNLRGLENKGLIKRGREISRGIEIVGRGRAGVRLVPVMGLIAAGDPIPVPESDGWSRPPDEEVEVLESRLRGRDQVYALRVKGQSMIDAMINDGDLVIIEHRAAADPGERVVAWLKDREETTLKKFYPEGDRVRLQPANPTMDPIYVDGENLEIQGAVLDVIPAM